MSELLRIILELSVTLLAGIISFVLGKRWEIRRQSLLIRAQMLSPIEEWLRGADRMIGILGDTITLFIADSPPPIIYDEDERRKAAQFMIEKTNAVLGILHSNSLSTRQTRKQAMQLAETITILDNMIRHALLPLDDEKISQSLKIDTPGFLYHVGETKLRSEVQQAYSLIAELKTAFT